MKALVLERFGSLTLVDHSDPVPAPDEIVVAVVATGICGTDVHGYTGENGRRVPGQVMGHETVGRVVTLGADVTGPPPGAVVTINPVVLPAGSRAAYAGREQHCPDKWVLGVRPDVTAAFAELVVVPATNVVELGTGMPITHGALVEPLAVAVHAVRRVRARSGDDVLVLGGGPIGQSIVLALRMAGITSVLVSEVSAARRKLITRLGAAAVDPTTAPLVDLTATHFGRPASIAIDAVGIDATVADALQATVQGATIGLVGMGSPCLGVDAYRVSTEERTLVGCFTYSAEDFRTAATWIAAAPPEAAELITREVRPDQADAAFRGLADGDDTPGKVLVRMDQTDRTTKED